ncbi:hypothetical protein ASG36_14630 [Geodermatophilus sp. Leaf369]|uniref:hypothetical protein n=1 Tax=Geodermatophilus sp. Leaf369 TaxID=1736354 RepID=UPI0006F8F008|nr:hypothetical protein [Geodermatophilus sp. Leaf369]KQS57824.1 hypothetical protein ASG36_14630 [Geodermatophilus sp. Leaf369]
MKYDPSQLTVLAGKLRGKPQDPQLIATTNSERGGVYDSPTYAASLEGRAQQATPSRWQQTEIDRITSEYAPGSSSPSKAPQRPSNAAFSDRVELTAPEVEALDDENTLADGDDNGVQRQAAHPTALEIIEIDRITAVHADALGLPPTGGTEYLDDSPEAHEVTRILGSVESRGLKPRPVTR